MDLQLREQCINTLRFLAADAIQQANSGHPGTPMGAADIAFVIWNQFLRYNPSDPQWANRDRFVLSAGHASMLLYSLLHLSGYDLPLEELKQFRQWDSLTPGHPEYGLTAGVECTTGPLGAGFGNAVGMALGAKLAGARFNTSDKAIIDAYTYVLCGDGDMQEGITAEAAAVAGHLGLGNLVVVYDKNDITIAGGLDISSSEDTAKRFEAYGWHVQECDGHDHEQIANCLKQAQQHTKKPSLIVATTVIGKGSPNKQGTASSHGAPLGTEEIQTAKQAAGWDPNVLFHVPSEVREVFQARAAENQQAYEAWQNTFQQWKSASPQHAEQWDAHWNLKTAEGTLEAFLASVEGQRAATRKLSSLVLQEASRLSPSLIGGSADLEPSTLTVIKDAASILPSTAESLGDADPSFAGKNIHYGIREHAMGNISNGLYLFGGWRPYCSTFLVFSDYMRASLRLAAISHIPSIFIFTHDSYGVGEDGPTHQPIEHASALRLIPNLQVWRPSDGIEVAAMWESLLRDTSKQPAALLLTRQTVENLERRDGFMVRDIEKGAYVVQDASQSTPQVVLLSTGSESYAAQEARKTLEQQGIATRHVSVPCVEKFQEQTASYQESVIPKGAKVIAIEAGVSDLWYRWADYVIGKDSFGASAPEKVLTEKLGFSAEAVTSNILNWLKENGS